MPKELQDLTWSILPKEFKEEIRRIWSVEGDCAIKYKSELHKHSTDFLYELFGDNLTSDAEGEEMLTVPKKTVLEMFVEAQKVLPTCEHVGRIQKRRTDYLRNLFGSKCLPDDANDGAKDSAKEPKPAEPKFKVGGKVIYKNTGKEKIVVNIAEDGRYVVTSPNGKSPYLAKESDLEPYTEPKADYLHADGELATSASTFTDPCQSQYKSQSSNLSQETANCDKEFDNILKDNFREHNRLNVAAVAMAGILANPNLTNGCGYMEAYREYIATQALYCADELIAECEKCHA